MKFDAILQDVGEFGRYQKRLFLLSGIPIIFVAFHKLVWVFLGAVPHHRCLTHWEDISNTTYDLPFHHLNASIPWDDKHSRWDRCTVFTENSSTQHCETWVYDKSEYISSVISDFDLVCHRTWIAPFIQTLYVVGELIGSTIWGALADRIGRRKVLVLLIILHGLSGVLAGLFQNYWSFLFFRVIVGFVSQGVILICFVLVTEFVGTTHRIIIGTASNYFFAIGYVVIAGLAYWIRNWQYLQIIVSLPIVLYFIALRWVPESARWLLSQNETEKALKIIKKLCVVNGKHLPKEFLAEIEAQLPAAKPKANFLDLFRYPDLRKKLLIMTYSWFVNSAVYYGLSLNTSNLGGNPYLNFLISAVMEFPAYTICIFILKYGGRRFPLFASMGIGGLALLSIILVPKDMVTATKALAMIGKFGITISYGIVYVYGVELYPTPVRNAGLGINSTSARVGAMIAPFVVLLTEYWYPLPFILLGGLAVTAGLMTFLLPETKGKALEESLTEAQDQSEPAPDSKKQVE